LLWIRFDLICRCFLECALLRLFFIMAAVCVQLLRQVSLCCSRAAYFLFFLRGRESD
jgi:hypothetical protein